MEMTVLKKKKNLEAVTVVERQPHIPRIPRAIADTLAFVDTVLAAWASRSMRR